MKEFIAEILATIYEALAAGAIFALTYAAAVKTTLLLLG